MSPLLRFKTAWVGFPVRKRRRGLRRSPERRWALRGVDLGLSSGEFVGVLGPNGAGKTTLLQAAAGVYRPDRGDVLSAGRVVSLIELVGDMSRELTAMQNLRVVGAVLGLSGRQLRDRVPQIRCLSGLEEADLSRRYGAYSAGMQLRLNFALAASLTPDVMVIDEVLSVADERFRERCVNWLEGIARDGGGVLMAGHDLSLIENTCSRVVVLKGGRLIADGAPGPVVSAYRASQAD